MTDADIIRGSLQALALYIEHGDHEGVTDDCEVCVALAAVDRLVAERDAAVEMAERYDTALAAEFQKFRDDNEGGRFGSISEIYSARVERHNAEIEEHKETFRLLHAAEAEAARYREALEKILACLPTYSYREPAAIARAALVRQAGNTT